MSDIHAPLEQYKNEFKAAFRKNVEAAFDEILATSQVDVEDNKTTCKVIDKLKVECAEVSSVLSRRKFLRVMTIILAIVLLLSYFIVPSVLPSPPPIDPLIVVIAGTVLGVVLLVLSFTTLRRRVKDTEAKLKEAQDLLKDSENKAWEKMEPLNSLLSWDIPTKLIEQTVPNINFDPFFNMARLTQLESEFGFNCDLGEDTSILFAHSGEIKGNPFVIATIKKHVMGTKTYTGYKTITWTEYVTDSNGKSRAVTRTQTLSASVTKPYPTYSDSSFLIYANEAAPKLIFTRVPNGIANDEGLFKGMRLRRKIRKLEKFSQNLTDEYSYTMMANQNFEAFFETKDRNDEVEYRLLFTPLAQQELIKLMQDKEEGYGDDFSIRKDKMINYVYPDHFHGFNLDTDPRRFMDYNVEVMRKHFIEFNVNYFRAVYFAFAPLLSIPLYQQIRTAKTIYGEDLINTSTYWEWESMVNSLGASKYAHPSCVTDTIIKTAIAQDSRERRIIDVIGRGFKGEDRVHYERVWGGDGRYHTVSVPWVLYIPVTQRTPLAISDHPEMDKDVIRNEQTRSYSIRQMRRKILVHED